jgi:ribosomal protein S18 acetylase RimI-like enzyme
VCGAFGTFAHQAYAACLRGPVNSNVRPRMTTAIRLIAAEDSESFHSCLDFVAREGRFLALLEAPPLERVREFVAENIKNKVPQVVAVSGCKVVGWCDIQPGWHHTLKHCGSLGMGLLPEFRGKRLGESLFTACLGLAGAAGVTRVELEVREDNLPAIALYKRLGFIQEGVKQRGMRVHGEYVNTIAMGLLLPRSR